MKVGPLWTAGGATVQSEERLTESFGDSNLISRNGTKVETTPPDSLSLRLTRDE